MSKFSTPGSARLGPMTSFSTSIARSTLAVWHRILKRTMIMVEPFVTWRAASLPISTRTVRPHPFTALSQLCHRPPPDGTMAR